MKSYRLLRSYRALAISYVLDWQLSAPSSLRAKKSALLLTAGSAWLANSIHSTMDTRSASRELIKAIFPRLPRRQVDRDHFPYRMSLTAYREGGEDGEGRGDGEGDGLVDDDDIVPCIPYGIIFLRPIAVGGNYPIPRFMHDTDAFLSEKAFRFFFGRCYEDLKAQLAASLIVVPRNPNRVHNRKQLRFPPTYRTDPPPSPIFDLAESGYSLCPVVHEDDSDSDSDPLENEEIDVYLTRIWHLFLVDIVQLSPNARRADRGSYIKLSEEERQNATAEIYQNHRLSEIFVDCEWKIADKNEWKANFNRLWPDQDKCLAGKVQNYKNARYYLKWKTFGTRTTEDAFRKAKARVWDLFQNLYWMPHAECDRIWRSGHRPGFTRASGRTGRGGAPLILVNQYPPEWVSRLHILS